MSRIAVHLPPGHPHGEPDRPVVVAYRLGRVREGIDNYIIHTGETIPLDEFHVGLFKQAEAEYPGCEVKLERLVMQEGGGDAAHWIPADGFDPEVHTPAPAGGGAARTFNVEAGQEAG